MGFLSALFKGGVALHQGEAVKEQNQDLESRVRQDPRTLLEGVERFTFAQKFLHHNLLYRVRHLPPGRHDERRRYYRLYLHELSQEFRMAKKELNRMTATKADVAALGMAIKTQNLEFDQLAQHLDEQLHTMEQRDAYLQRLQSRHRWLLFLVVVSVALSLLCVVALVVVIVQPKFLPTRWSATQAAFSPKQADGSAARNRLRPRRVQKRRRDRPQRSRTHKAKQVRQRLPHGLQFQRGDGRIVRIRRTRRIRLFATATFTARARITVTRDERLRVLGFSSRTVCTRRRQAGARLHRCQAVVRKGNKYRCIQGREKGRIFQLSSPQRRKWLVCWGAAVKVRIHASPQPQKRQRTGWLPGYYLTRYR